MSEVWPLDVRNRLLFSSGEAIRPFKCLLLMPFESRFNKVSDIIKETVEDVLNDLAVQFSLEKPEINRLDWVTSSGVIQQQIWQEILESDLIFCDITGFNPNVLFEAGVCASWKKMNQVAFIKDHFFRQMPAFDITPIRYTEYELTSDGIDRFREKVVQLTRDALLSFPDELGSAPKIKFPLTLDFSGNRDDLSLFTPSFSHRRVINESFEFGSLFFFSHSWASIGKERLLNFEVDFEAKFINPLPNEPKIGIALRSQNYLANYGHFFNLNGDGSIHITEPHHDPPMFYENKMLREPTSIDYDDYHHFCVKFSKKSLLVSVDDFKHEILVSEMVKVFGPGLIRLYSVRSLMAIKSLRMDVLEN